MRQLHLTLGARTCHSWDVMTFPAFGNADSPGHAGLGRRDTYVTRCSSRWTTSWGGRTGASEVLGDTGEETKGVTRRQESTEVALAAVCVDDNVRWPGDEATMEENRRDEDETGAEFKW